MSRPVHDCAEQCVNVSDVAAQDWHTAIIGTTATANSPKENPGTIAVVTEADFIQEALELPECHNMPGPIIAMHWGVAA
jgi:hypothetical protein